MTRLAIITGSSRGIGRAIAKRLAQEEGLQVLVTARTPEAAKEAADSISKEVGSTEHPALWRALDLLQPDTVTKFRDYVKSLKRPVDILVNNAGMAYKGDAFDEKVARETVGCNYYGTKLVTEALLPYIQPDGGRIVFVSSRAGNFDKITNAELRERLLGARTVEELDALAEDFVRSVGDGSYAQHGWPRQTYAVSKMLETMYAVILAQRLRSIHPHVLVNAMCPGYVKTDMTSHRGVKTVEEGADTAVFLALLPREAEQEPHLYSGCFWAERQRLELRALGPVVR
jgi:carbonyl reductase 1